MCHQTVSPPGPPHYDHCWAGTGDSELFATIPVWHAPLQLGVEQWDCVWGRVSAHLLLGRPVCQAHGGQGPSAGVHGASLPGQLVGGSRNILRMHRFLPGKTYGTCTCMQHATVASSHTAQHSRCQQKLGLEASPAICIGSNTMGSMLITCVFLRYVGY
jgi:hypothetical protein